MLVSLDIGENVYLVDGALLKLFVLSEFGDGNDFDGILFFIVIIDGPVDFSVDPRANGLI